MLMEGYYCDGLHNLSLTTIEKHKKIYCFLDKPSAYLIVYVMELFKNKLIKYEFVQCGSFKSFAEIFKEYLKT